MTDLDSFRAALQAPLDRDFGAIDLVSVMAAGRRVRRVRRAVAGVVVAAAVAAVLMAFSAIGPRADLPQPPAVSARVVAWGEVISTGIEDGGGERVFYVVPVDIAELPQVHLGVMAGRRDGGGRLTADVLVNEVTGPDRSAGFHGVWAGIGPDGTTVPAFGYYVGPVARITARVGGRVVTATQAVWSEDPRLVVFWFDPADLRGGPPSELAAYDSTGTRLPDGNTDVVAG